MKSMSSSIFEAATRQNHRNRFKVTEKKKHPVHRVGKHFLYVFFYHSKKKNVEKFYLQQY